MKCSECGQPLPDSAAFCSACGRRVLRERIEPVLDARSAAETPGAAQPPRAWRMVELEQLPDTRPYSAQLSEALAAWPHAPHAAVVLGCVLAVLIYFSAAHDKTVADRVGAERIVAATGARATTSQPAPAGALQFSAKQALQGLYGNYDPVLDGSFWTVSGAPKRWTDWNGRAVLIRPLVLRSDDAGTRHVLVTHTVAMRNGMVVKQGAGCRECASLIGGALFERQGNEWRLVSDQRFLGVEGAFGAPPQVVVSFPEKAGVELRIEPSRLAETEEQAPAVVMEAGVKTKGVLRQPRPRPVQPPRVDSPFPSSASSP